MPDRMTDAERHEFLRSNRLILYTQVFFGTLAVASLVVLGGQEYILYHQAIAFGVRNHKTLQSIDSRMESWITDQNARLDQTASATQKNTQKLQTIERTIKPVLPLIQKFEAIQKKAKAVPR